MIKFFKDKGAVALYVHDLLRSLPSASLSTMTIVPDVSGGYYVLIAIGTGLVGGTPPIVTS
jgi:hypothetical protein